MQVMKRIWRIGLFLGVVATSTATINSTVTYYRDVLPILQNHCQSCHRPGQVAPMSFQSYRETRPWAEAMKYAVLAKKMPPWLAEKQYAPVADHSKLKLNEIETIVRWVDEGAPAGDPKDAPPPAYLQEGRRLNDPFLRPFRNPQGS